MLLLATLRAIAFLVLTTLWFAAVGPFIGGILVNVFIVGIPFSYAIGLIPAVLAGLLYGLLMVFRVAPVGKKQSSALIGGVLGAVTTAGGFVAFAIYVGMAKMFDPIKMTSDETPADVPRVVSALVVILPWLAVLTYASFGALGGAFCAYYMPKGLIRLSSVLPVGPEAERAAAQLRR